MHSIFKISLSLLIVKSILAIENENNTSSLSSDRSFSTSHSISINGVPFPREGRGFHQTVRPNFDMELRQVIGDNVRSIIDSNEKLSSNQDNFPPSKMDINDINLFGAGSEQKPKSRIVTKKGENGKEYEYEYYYYYEEDSAADDEDIVDTNSESSFNPEEKSSVKQDIPLFSRHVTNVSETIDNNKRNSIRRPSLDLVDSQSFNTNEKKTTQSNIKNVDIQLSLKELDDGNLKVGVPSEDSDTTSARPSVDSSDTTAFIMEKSALDLYAMLANENLNSENEVYTVTTTDKVEVTTELDNVSTTVSTITTTISQPTTTSTQEATSTKRTVSNVLPVRSRTRISGLTGKRRDSISETTTSNPTIEKASPTKRRFSSASAFKNSEPIDKKDEKPENGKKFGSGYNRFNLKPSVTRTTEEPNTESPSSTTRSVLGNRQRPGFGSRRGAQKITSSTTYTSETNLSQSEANTEESVKSQSPIANKLSRVNIKGRRNPLLSRKREETNPTENSEDNKEHSTEASTSETPVSLLKQRGRLNISSFEKPSAPTPNVINRRVNPLLRSRVISTSTEASESTANKENEKETDEHPVTEEIKNESTNETTTPKPSGLAALRRKILLRQPAKEKA